MRDVEFDDGVLEIVFARKSVFAALSDRTLRRGELESELDVSTSTCHRIVRDLESNGLLERTDCGWTLTELGRAVGERTAWFQRSVRTAYRLEPLLEAFADAAVDFDADLFADATVTPSTPEDSSPPINRYLELFRDADAVRTLDRTSFIPPLYIEKVYELAREDGKTVEAVFPKSVVRKRLTEFADIHRVAAAEFDALYRVCDGVPFGMTLYDDEHVGLRAYDDASGALLVFVDTDDPEAVDWAHGVYDHYYEQSRPLSAVDDLPDWLPEDI